MTPCTSPSETTRSIPAKATRPPNRLLRPVISSSTVVSPQDTCSSGARHGPLRADLPAQRDKAASDSPAVEIAADAAGHVHHRQHADHAKDDELVLVIGA